jgi:hypothetical protein
VRALLELPAAAAALLRCTAAALLRCTAAAAPSTALLRRSRSSVVVVVAMVPTTMVVAVTTAPMTSPMSMVTTAPMVVTTTPVVVTAPVAMMVVAVVATLSESVRVRRIRRLNISDVSMSSSWCSTLQLLRLGARLGQAATRALARLDGLLQMTAQFRKTLRLLLLACDALRQSLILGEFLQLLQCIHTIGQFLHVAPTRRQGRAALGQAAHASTVQLGCGGARLLSDVLEVDGRMQRALRGIGRIACEHIVQLRMVALAILRQRHRALHLMHDRRNIVVRARH